MEVRTFKGRHLSEVMAKIRREVGDDALIVNTNEGKRQVEVEVMIGAEKEAQKTVPEPHEARYFKGAHHSGLLELNREITEDINELLEGQGIDDTLKSMILSNLPEKWRGTGTSTNDNVAAEDMDRLVSRSLEKAIAFDSIICADEGKQKIMAFIGTTGVGKTTTIAKLAAQLRMAFDIKIGLISADTYRVGAGMQLRAYAEMLKVPFKSLGQSEDIGAELKKALTSFRHLDLVLIDTAGCSTREIDRISAMEKILGGINEIEKVLLLPAPSNKFDLHAALHAFSPLNCTKIVITKLDESGYIGPVLNSVIKAGKPLAFLTTGQKVPEDIEPASPRRLAWMLTRQIH